MNEVEESLVSIVLPVYNAEKYIEQSISSLLAQTYQNIELIIINDGSTDSSLSVICKFEDPRIRCVTNEKNSGLVYSLNKGIELASGQYIFRMDADDLSLPTRIADQVDFFVNNPSVGILGTWAKVVDTNLNKKSLKKPPRTNDRININLYFGSALIHPSVAFNMNNINISDLYYSDEWTHAEDYELWCRLSRKYEMANINNVLLLYREHDANVSLIHSKEQLTCFYRIRDLYFGTKFSKEFLIISNLIHENQFLPLSFRSFKILYDELTIYHKRLNVIRKLLVLMVRKYLK